MIMITERKVVNGREVVTGRDGLDHHHHHHASLSWGAVVAGGLVGLGLSFLLHLFGMAMGLSAYSSTADGARMVAVGGFIGLLIGSIAAMGAAGYVAGYLGRCFHCYRYNGVIYGFAAWSVALVLGAALLSPLADYMKDYHNGLTGSYATNGTGNNTTGTTAGNRTGMNDNTSLAENPAKDVAEKTVGPVDRKDLAYAGWLTFIIFFIGALSACVGGVLGQASREDEFDRHVM